MTRLPDTQPRQDATGGDRPRLIHAVPPGERIPLCGTDPETLRWDAEYAAGEGSGPRQPCVVCLEEVRRRGGTWRG